MLYEQLVENGYKVLITHYGDLVKYICKTFFNWNGEKDENGRHILQYVGTDIVREQKPDYWVSFVLDMLELFGDNWDYVIIPDARFPNEIDALKTVYRNVIHIKVDRPGYESDLTEEQLKHSSETALDDVEPNYLFWNVGSLEDMRDAAKSFISSLDKEEDKDA